MIYIKNGSKCIFKKHQNIKKLSLISNRTKMKIIVNYE